MDPAGGDLVGRIVNGIETIFGQAIGDPGIKILAGQISCNPELTDADGVRKNSHNPPPHVTKNFVNAVANLLKPSLYGIE